MKKRRKREEKEKKKAAVDRTDTTRRTDFRFRALTVRGQQLVRERGFTGITVRLDVYLGPIIYDYDYSGRLSSALY